MFDTVCREEQSFSRTVQTFLFEEATFSDERTDFSTAWFSRVNGVVATPQFLNKKPCLGRLARAI
jgi:hypothetical protein